MDKLLFKYYISKQLFVDYKKFVGLHKIFAWFIPFMSANPNLFLIYLSI